MGLSMYAERLEEKVKCGQATAAELGTEQAGSIFQYDITASAAHGARGDRRWHSKSRDQLPYDSQPGFRRNGGAAS
jgi:hypothetical protein